MRGVPPGHGLRVVVGLHHGHRRGPAVGLLPLPGPAVGNITHRRRVPEGWLREVVVGLIRHRLFPPAVQSSSSEPNDSHWDAGDLVKTDWFPELAALIQEELDRDTAARPDQRAHWRPNCRSATPGFVGGPSPSGNPALDPSVRAVLEAEMAAGSARRAGVARTLAAADAADRCRDRILDPAAVVDRLNRLADVLVARDPTRSNIELAQHIEGIYCFDDGRVVVRTCKLGALAGATDLVADGVAELVPLCPAPPGVFAGTRAGWPGEGNRGGPGGRGRGSHGRLGHGHGPVQRSGPRMVLGGRVYHPQDPILVAG